MKNDGGLGLVALVIFSAISVTFPGLFRVRGPVDKDPVIAETRTAPAAEETDAAADAMWTTGLVDLCRGGPECVGVVTAGYTVNAPELLNGDFDNLSAYATSGYDRIFEAMGSVPNMDPDPQDPKGVGELFRHPTSSILELAGVRAFMGAVLFLD